MWARKGRDGSVPSGHTADRGKRTPLGLKPSPAVGSRCLRREGGVLGEQRPGTGSGTKPSLHLTCRPVSARQSLVCVCAFADEEDKDSLQELAVEQKCFVEHILCTKPLPCR